MTHSLPKHHEACAVAWLWGSASEWRGDRPSFSSHTIFSLCLPAMGLSVLWQGVGMGTYIRDYMDLDGHGYGAVIETPPSHAGISGVLVPWYACSGTAAESAYLHHDSHVAAACLQEQRLRVPHGDGDEGAAGRHHPHHARPLLLLQQGLHRLGRPPSHPIPAHAPR